ncbi:hypothetical protein [Cryptosporangium sp. NPDC051539]|uniref:hypothetical protein n=1 Tax=Cryptosporangium sp. NPDC051539 TaxID=3363962 RepID=UPI00379A9912
MSAAVGWVLTAWERGAPPHPVDRAVGLLAALAGLSWAEAAAVDVGSRDGVLIEGLRELCSGPVRTVLTCGGCGETLQVPVDPRELPVSPWRAAGARFTVPVSGRSVEFRLPTSVDLRALTGPAADARFALLSWCVPDLDLDAGQRALLVDAVERAMEEAAESAALTVLVRCGECGAETEAAVDVGALLWAEVQAAAVALLQDVHVLAEAYGWTEPEILALSPARRAVYLELIG